MISMKSLGTKAALVFAVTAVSATMFASVALAAPTLDAGQTSGGPHDSRGNCASCHSYKTSAAKPAPAPTPAPTPAPAAPSSVTTVQTGTGQYTIIIINPPYATAPAAVVPQTTVTPPTGGDYDDEDDD